ncbi:MAG: hypothetical protein HXX09_16090, partial [Bacteroidetes bacterium]|nr:hypothetical protein [Bacteroidota bacterium]
MAFCQNGEIAERPKYAPRSDKSRNITDLKGKQGLWKVYSWERILISETTYLNDIRHGPCTKYFSFSGLIREESNYVFGKKDGSYKNYYNNGQVNSEGTYKDGKKTDRWVSYYKTSGEKRSEGNYLENKKTGIWNFYNSRGVPRSSGAYQNDLKVGPWVTLDSDGKVILAEYVNGVLKVKEPKILPKKIK